MNPLNAAPLHKKRQPDHRAATLPAAATISIITTLTLTAVMNQQLQDTTSTHTPDEGSGGLPTRQDRYETARIDWQSEGRLLTIRTAKRVLPDEEEEAASNVAREDHETTLPVRSKIGGFSDASRRRMRHMLYSLRRDTRMLFVTLTYHTTTPTPDEVKRHLDTLAKRIYRARPDISMIWRMEPHESGRPHVHIFLTRCGYWGVKQLSRIWHTITGETSDEHLKTSVDVERIDEETDKWIAYVTKYITKAEECSEWPVERLPEEEREAWEYPGRYWGVYNRQSLPVAETDGHLTIDHDDAERLIQDLLDEWDVNIPDGVIPPSLTVCVDGAPGDRALELMQHLDRIHRAGEWTRTTQDFEPDDDLPF